VSHDFAGASETFLFWRNEDTLPLLANEVVCGIEGVIDNGGVVLLNLYYKAIRVLEYSLLGALATKLDFMEFDRRSYKWSSASYVGRAVTAPRSGNFEELHDWAINRVMSLYKEFSSESQESLSQIKEYVKIKARDFDLLSIASELFVNKLATTSSAPPSLGDFGMTRADLNKLDKWKEWCDVEVKQ
jgi:hypothetical protein